MPLVKKTNYRQKKQRIKELENQLNNSKNVSPSQKPSKRKEELEQEIEQLQNQINQFNALQKKKPIQARTLIIRELARKRYNAQSLLNGIRKAERERERATHQYRLNFQRKLPNLLIPLCRIIVNWIVQPQRWAMANLFRITQN